MIHEVIAYAFGNAFGSCPFISDEIYKTESALREGYVVIARCEDHFAQEIVAIMLHIDKAKALLAAYGKGYMMINPDGIITYVVSDTEQVTKDMLFA